MSTAIEEWLTSLLRSQRNPGGLAPKSVRHIQAVMRLLFKYAVKWGYLNRNPMGNKHDKLVELPRGSTKRARKPVQLTADQFLRLLSHLETLAKLAIALTGWLGPRISEAFGLKWGDIDFLVRVVCFERGVVEGRVTPLKTEASRSELPLPDDLRELLLAWRRLTPYRTAEDWVFASPATKGKRPYWHGQLLQDHVHPVARQLGLPKIGWHSLRHSYMAWGKAAGLAAPALKQLLRDSTDQMINDYGAIDIEAKRDDVERVHAYVRRTAAASKKEKPGTIQ
jgi:integrase